MSTPDASPYTIGQQLEAYVKERGDLCLQCGRSVPPPLAASKPVVLPERTPLERVVLEMRCTLAASRKYGERMANSAVVEETIQQWLERLESALRSSSVSESREKTDPDPSPSSLTADPALPRQSCCAPAPDRSGRSCDKPRGHAGEHWTYGGNTLTWAADPASPAPQEPREDEDFAWARERVVRMCASALVDAQVYRQKLLKGFGYPNETFRAAQDYRALSIVLDRLAQLTASSSASPSVRSGPGKELNPYVTCSRTARSSQWCSGSPRLPASDRRTAVERSTERGRVEKAGGPVAPLLAPCRWGKCRVRI